MRHCTYSLTIIRRLPSRGKGIDQTGDARMGRQLHPV
jgi:hypothetical protein